MEKSCDGGRLDVSKLLGATAPISWGGLLGSLPKGTVDYILSEARRLNSTLPHCTKEEAQELAQVQSALSTEDRALSNLFAPFVVPVERTPEMPTVHWGNVDTGAMVNVVYEGVVRVFKELDRYLQPFHHEIIGVGGKRTKIVGKLVNVPIRLGQADNKSEAYTTTFFVVENSEYHWILGLPLLAKIHGKVDCNRRTLEFLPPGVAIGNPTHLPCITRRESRETPVRAEFRLKSPHLESEEAVNESCWEAATLQVEEKEYVGNSLIDLLGRH